MDDYKRNGHAESKYNPFRALKTRAGLPEPPQAPHPVQSADLSRAVLIHPAGVNANTHQHTPGWFPKTAPHPPEPNTDLSKRDKRKQQISARLHKLEYLFAANSDNYYRELLHNLQTKLATLQQGSDPELVHTWTTFSEQRDYELLRLRLWEEYQVKMVEEQYQDDVVRANANRDNMIRLIKEKLYDKMQRQIKQLKEEKLLLNLVNASLWSTHNAELAANTAALTAAAASIGDRRLLRKRELSTKFTAGEAEYLSDGGSGNTSAAVGYISASGKRRRHYATRYSSNDESSGMTSGAGKTTAAASSGNDSNLSDKDYDALNSLIMDNDDGGASLVMLDHREQAKVNTRAAHRQFLGPQGLKAEELNDDLELLRAATGG